MGHSKCRLQRETGPGMDPRRQLLHEMMVQDEFMGSDRQDLVILTMFEAFDDEDEAENAVDASLIRDPVFPDFHLIVTGEALPEY